VIELHQRRAAAKNERIKLPRETSLLAKQPAVNGVRSTTSSSCDAKWPIEAMWPIDWTPSVTRDPASRRYAILFEDYRSDLAGTVSRVYTEGLGLSPPPVAFEDTIGLEPAPSLRDGHRVDPQGRRHLADARDGVPRAEPSPRHERLDLVGKLPVDRHARRGMDDEDRGGLGHLSLRAGIACVLIH
jgi:hypothetical protein